MKKKKAKELLADHQNDNYNYRPRSIGNRRHHDHDARINVRQNEEWRNGNGQRNTSSHPVMHTLGFRDSIFTVPVAKKDNYRHILVKELVKWGINLHGNDDHAFFKKLILKELDDCVEGRATEWSPPIIKNVMPQHFSDAIHFLLHKNLERRTNGGSRLEFTKEKDWVMEEYQVSIPYPPFFSIRGSLRLNGEYRELQGLDIKNLDPLKRFTYHSVDAEEAITSEWTELISNDRPNHIAEAAAIHYAIVGGNHACLACNETALFWNSNLENYSFSNVVCGSCDSMYTFWGTTSTEKVMKTLERQSFTKGRSFAYCHNELQNLGRSSKMYVVLLPMSEMRLPFGMPAYPAEIIGVTPALNQMSFNIEQIRIKCNVQLKPLPTSRPWFHVKIPSNFDGLAVSTNVIKDYFRDKKGEHVLANDSSRVGKGAPLERINAKDQEFEGTNLRSRIRNLRRKRNLIEKIKSKREAGEKLQSSEVDVLIEEEEVSCELEKLENILRLD